MYEFVINSIGEGGDITEKIAERIASQGAADIHFDRVGLDIPPLLPTAHCSAFVCSFGYTFNYINGVLAPERDAPDWYYKGHGASLSSATTTLVRPYYGSGMTIEGEHVAVYLVDRAGRPRYIGYSLANDASDATLRHEKPSLAALSKLYSTPIARELVIHPLPASREITANIIRDGNVIWERAGLLGTDHMRFPLADLERLLFQHSHLLIPGMVFYVLLGAAISSSKDWIELTHGDRIVMKTSEDSLEVSSTFLDEAVIYSCCV